MAVETRPELVGKRFLCVGGGGGEEPPESGRWRAGVIRAVSQRDSHSHDLAVRAASRDVGGDGHRGGGAGPTGEAAGSPGRARRDTAPSPGGRRVRGDGACLPPAAGTAGVEPASPGVEAPFPSASVWWGRRRRPPSCPCEGTDAAPGRAAACGGRRRIPGLGSEGENGSAAAGAAGLGGECVCSRGMQKLSSCSTDRPGPPC